MSACVEGKVNQRGPCFQRAHYLCAVVAAVLDDPLHLLVDQLHAAQTGLLQAFHLLLHQQLEGNLGHKQGRTRALVCRGRSELQVSNYHPGQLVLCEQTKAAEETVSVMFPLFHNSSLN